MTKNIIFRRNENQINSAKSNFNKETLNKESRYKGKSSQLLLKKDRKVKKDTSICISDSEN